MELDLFAKEYQQKHGFPPLIIGHEYSLNDTPVVLIEASSLDKEVFLTTRFAENIRCEKSELRWRPKV